jgi:hypothetical protein
VAVDGAGGKVYWADQCAEKIQRANLDGTGVQDLVTGLSSPSAIAVDGAGGKVYWDNTGTHKVQRANLDGSNVQDLVVDRSVSRNGVALNIHWGHPPRQLGRLRSRGSSDRLARAGQDRRSIAGEPQCGEGGPLCAASVSLPR